MGGGGRRGREREVEAVGGVGGGGSEVVSRRRWRCASGLDYRASGEERCLSTVAGDKRKRKLPPPGRAGMAATAKAQGEISALRLCHGVSGAARRGRERSSAGGQ